MIRAAILLAALAAAVPAHAQGPVRLHCTLEGATAADWRGQDGLTRVRFRGERAWSTVPADAAGPMLALLWAGGAKCERKPGKE